MEDLLKSASFPLDTRFFFPSSIVYHAVSDTVIAVSPTTANWLVLASHHEQLWLECLLSGVTIRSLLRRFGDRVVPLISQIAARGFAGVTSPPRIELKSTTDSIYVYLTNACNLRCSHCYMRSTRAEENELSVAQWISLIHEFVHHNGRSVTFTGGEPLLKEGWQEVIKTAKQCGLTVTLLSNGTLWNDADIRFASEYIDEVQVSLDGPTEKLNALIRGQDTFLPTLKTVKSLCREHKKISLALTPTLSVLRDANSDFVRFAKNMIAATDGRLHIRMSHRFLPDRSGTILSSENARQYGEAMSHIAEEVYPQSSAYNFAADHRPNMGIENCGYGCLSFGANGAAFPCNRILEVNTLGDITKSTFADLLDRGKALVAATSVDHASPCVNCDLRYICGGGCRIDDFTCASCASESMPTQSGVNQISQFKCDATWKNKLLLKMKQSTTVCYAFHAAK